MVASAKLHKVQNAITNMLPYESQLHEILSRKAGTESRHHCRFIQQLALRCIQCECNQTLQGNSSKIR